MAKRFIETNIKILRSLSADQQRAWWYMWEKCDAAGVYEYDPLYMSADLNMDKAVPFEEILKIPTVKKINGSTVLLTSFLDVNVNLTIKSGYNPHKPILRAIEKIGAEHFSGLGLKIEIKKESVKEIIEFEAWFKLENKKIKLVKLDEDVDEDENKIGGVGERLGSEMYRVFLQRFGSKYHKREPNDMPAISIFGDEITKHLGIPELWTDLPAPQRAKVSAYWIKFLDWYDENGNNKSLDYLVKFKIQEILNEIKNGKITRRTLATNFSGNGGY